MEDSGARTMLRPGAHSRLIFMACLILQNVDVFARRAPGLKVPMPSVESSKECDVVVPNMVSLFQPDEKELDRYSVALAASHRLREKRDNTIKETTNPVAYLYLKMKKGDQYARWMSSPLVSDAARDAQSDYLRQAGRVITSCGMTTSHFNQLSRTVAIHKDLRVRVHQQVQSEVLKEMDQVYRLV
ncbi:unnamed protein product [Choristocarpus tenellus]